MVDSMLNDMVDDMVDDIEVDKVADMVIYMGHMAWAVEVKPARSPGPEAPYTSSIV